MLKILITGITGFLGAHIAEYLCQNGFDVIGVKRSTSDIWRCKEFANRIHWINIDSKGNWKSEAIRERPDVIIHSAWIGVEAADRDNWNSQLKNISFLVEILEISRMISLKKIIFLGSQAEYGFIDCKVTEEAITNAESAYGKIKLASLEFCQACCKLNGINWVWLRLFSVFGENENKGWLIPSVIQRMKNGKQMDFTLGEQKYAYMYVKDFAKIIQGLITKDIVSGIYNVSSNEVVQLRSLIEYIKMEVNPEFILNFGALKYRANQSMHIEGDISKLETQIGPVYLTNFRLALQATIQHYISK